MDNIKKILIRIIVIAVVLFAFNYIYKRFFYEQDIQKYSEIINLLRDVQDNSEILYLGESSNFTFRSDDVDKRPISEFIADYYPEKKLGTINKGAVHAGIYKVILENIPESSPVETIIITMNLRSFNAGWRYSKLETSLQKQIVLLKDNPPLFNRFILSFKGYDIKDDDQRTKQVKRNWRKNKLEFPFDFPYTTVTDWDREMAKINWLKPDGTRDKDKVQLGCHYVKTYAFQIDTNSNQRIKDFDNIVKLCKKRGWNLVLNLMAENLEKANTLVGKELVYLMKQNRDLLVDRYSKKGVIVVDNLNNIHNDQYIDQNWTTEHYAETGRKTIANNVADSLKVFYHDKYVKPDYTEKVRTKFFHDCEKTIPWGQMSSLTDEKAFSGKKSSKTGNGNDFSIAFSFPFQKIPDTSRNICNVEFQLFQSSIDKTPKLVIALSGENIDFNWHGKELINFTKTINEWSKISYSYKIPKAAQQGDLIKVYVYNPGKNIIYIDDLKIEFF